MNTTLLPTSTEKRNVTTVDANRTRTISSSQQMPFAWSIQPTQSQPETKARQIVVVNCPPEVYLG